MLRSIFISVLFLVGLGFALRGPLEALVLYLWIAYFRPEEWVWNPDFFYAFKLSYIAGVYLLLRSLAAFSQFRFDFRAVLLFAMLAQCVLSTSVSDYQAYSSQFLRDFAITIVISYLVAVLASDVSRMRIVFLAICLSLSFESAKQGWVQLIFNPGGTNANPVPFLGDNNGVAVGMLMLVPMLIALARTAAGKKEKWLHNFLALGVLYRAISTYSRGGFLAAGALGLVYLLRSPKRNRALLAAAVAGTIVLSVLPPEFWDRMSTIRVEEGQERDSSAAGRLHFWEVALVMAKDNPIFGVGTNAYNPAYSRYDFSERKYGGARSVHSAWFGVLAELGYFGLFIFMGNLILGWLACRRARKLAKAGKVSAALGHFATGLEGALVAFAIGSSFVIFQYVEMLWHLVGLTMAVHWVTERELAERAKPAAAAPPLVAKTA